MLGFVLGGRRGGGGRTCATKKGMSILSTSAYGNKRVLPSKLINSVLPSLATRHWPWVLVVLCFRHVHSSIFACRDYIVC